MATYEGVALRFVPMSRSENFVGSFDAPSIELHISQKSGFGPWQPFARLPVSQAPSTFAESFALLKPFLQAQTVLDIEHDWKRWCVEHDFQGDWNVLVLDDAVFPYSSDERATEEMRQRMPVWLIARLKTLQHCLIPDPRSLSLCVMGNLDITLPSSRHERLAFLQKDHARP